MLHQEASKTPENQVRLRKRFLCTACCITLSSELKSSYDRPKMPAWSSDSKSATNPVNDIAVDLWFYMQTLDFITCMFFYDQFQKPVSRRVALAKPVSLFPMTRLSLYFLPPTITKRGATGERTSN